VQIQTNEFKNQSASNAIFVIAPYWSSGTWVFDDPSRDLVREPFVSGVPEILSDLVKEIPNAKSGFRLLFSSQPFPGLQAHYRKLNSEYSGTWYSTDDGRSGWLCPALFKYFPKAPNDIYVRAEPLT
jgi:hypothetical protein